MSEYENKTSQLCSEVGLSCRDCTASAARELAAVCHGLRPKAVAQLFFQMYPEPDCARMREHFTAAYRAASRTPEPQVMAAVA
jgi:hypothetical protein